MIAVCILVLCAALGPISWVTAVEIDLSHYSESVFLPFVGHHDNRGASYYINCRVSRVEKEIQVHIDTGSGLFLLGAPFLKGQNSSVGTPAHHFFTSSQILYVGRLVPLFVTFLGEVGTNATAYVPVLVVDKSWSCPWYNPSTDGPDCPVKPDGQKPIERNTSTIKYMGVGFGRNKPEDGMPFANHTVNPFLNIYQTNGLAIQRGSMRTGYTISTKGISLGLTQNNTKGITWMKLQPQTGNTADPGDWAMASMCFSIDGVGKHCGPGLIDTGISQMYIRPKQGFSMPIVETTIPTSNGSEKLVRTVKPGTKIAVGFPNLDAPIASYSFVVDDQKKSPMDPTHVILARSGSEPFINTGRNFYKGYSIAFDAWGGHYGFVRVADPGSS